MYKACFIIKIGVVIGQSRAEAILLVYFLELFSGWCIIISEFGNNFGRVKDSFILI
jgi:hypothetical protein